MTDHLTQHLLTRRHLPVLTEFALSNVLLAFDYDGTLSPIADQPEDALLRPSTRELLSRVAELYPCVVISGRSLDDVAQRLDPVPLWYVFGNHGAEPSPQGATQVAQTREWVRELRDRLDGNPGLVIEDKLHSVTIHYRGAQDRAAALSAIGDAVRVLSGVRPVGGIEAVNLIPQGGRDKGAALRDAMHRFACDTAIYVGDDATDEDAFAALPPDRLLSIRVGRSGQTRARYHLASQAAIDQLLSVLVSARERRYAAAR